MAQKGRNTDMFKQLEEVMKRCDSLSQEIKTVKKNTEFEVSGKYNIKLIALENKIDSLENTIKEKDEKISKLTSEVDRLKSQINKDSDNSSKPPSSDIKKNIPNNREKTNNNIGGQKGHKPHFLSKKSIENRIKNNEFKHEIIEVKKENSNKYISKYIVDIEVITKVTEYRFYADSFGKYNVPKEFKTDVQYGNELKTMCCILSNEDIVAYDRLTDFVSAITKGKITMSNASAVNFNTYLSKKIESTIETFRTKILNSTMMYTDGTSARCDNRNVMVRNYSTDDLTLLVATKGKGKKYLESTGILNNYLGNLIHDHETVMYNYGKDHGECNSHICRYLLGNYENTNNNWSLCIRSFLCSLNEYKKSLISKGIKSITEEKYNSFTKRYDEIIELGDSQNENVKSKYLKKQEKALLNRLKKYRKNHLLFIEDFDIPFDNNLSERELRHVKTKQKISGTFRSIENLQKYLDIKSLIITCKKKKLDFFKIIFNIFENTPVEI